MPAGEDQRLNGLETRVPSGPELEDLNERCGRDVGIGVAATSQRQMRPAWPHHRTYRKDSHAKTHSPAMGHRRQHRRGGGRRAQLRVRGALFDTTNPAFKASVMGLIDSVDTLILGANTYAQAKDCWPYAEDQGEYGEKLNNVTKFVASSKLDTLGRLFPPRP
jgi:hypothetical protein